MVARRGKRNLTTDEMLIQAKDELAIAEENVRNLKAKIKDLEVAKEQEELKELRKLILDSGKSINDVREMLSQK